jgi:hypothetical protein
MLGSLAFFLDLVSLFVVRQKEPLNHLKSYDQLSKIGFSLTAVKLLFKKVQITVFHVG